MKFREHRGELHESMATVCEIADHAALLARVRERWGALLHYSDEQVTVRQYPHDKRVGWNTHIVSIDGLPVGFTDGPSP